MSELAPQDRPGSEHGFELGCDGPMVLVVGVDGTDTSWRALAYALGQARRQGSTVAAVYARTPAVGAGLAMDPRILDDQAADLRDQIGALAREVGVHATFNTVVADPAAALHAVAEKVHADAIVVGASSRKAHRLYGSTALRAVRQGKWPVTVVP